MEFIVVYMGIGVLAGLLAGLLGVGGGAVTVPLLLWSFAAEGIDDGIATHMALATSLAAMVVTSFSSALAHAQKQAVLWSVLVYLVLGVVFGSLIGVFTAVKISGQVLQVLFALFLSYVSLQMIIGFSATANRQLPGGLGLFGAGSVIGTVSMYFGIGGGSLTVPFLSYCGLPPVKAVGTSAALGLPIAIWGSVLYVVSGWNSLQLPEYSLGYVYGPAAIGIVLTSFIFARVGAALAHRMKANHLRNMFGVVLLLVAINLFWENLFG